MAYGFTVKGHIARPLAEVFEAVADPEQLSQYFSTGGARGRLEAGAVVQWDFHDFPGAFPVHVVEVVRNARIVLNWGPAPDEDAAGSFQTEVVFSFDGLEDGRTLVSIHEAGWRESEAGLAASYSSCEGWTGMLCAMRVWLEHGIRFRQGFYA